MQCACTRVSTLFVVAALVFAPAFAAAQTITTFDPPNSTSTFAVAINLSGQIAGTYIDGSVSPVIAQKGFLRERDGTFTTFIPEVTLNDRTYQLAPRVNDLNLEGDIVGTVNDPYPITSSSFLRRRDGSIVVFKDSGVVGSSPDPAAMLKSALPCEECIDGSGAFGINAIGQITGMNGMSSYVGYLRQPDGTTTFFSPAGSLATFPKAINLFGQITGYFRAPYPDRGFLRQPNGTFVQFVPPNSVSTRPRSINLFSQIAGYYRDANGMEHGFLRQPNGKIVTFDPAGSTGTEAESINFAGEITGAFTTADGNSHGFLRKANGKIESFDAPGASGGTFAKEVNDLGVIVGYYEDANSIVHGFVRTRN